MKIAVVAGLLAKWDMDIYAGQFQIIELTCKVTYRIPRHLYYKVYTWVALLINLTEMCLHKPYPGLRGWKSGSKEGYLKIVLIGEGILNQD